jgi:hypothetical protein
MIRVQGFLRLYGRVNDPFALPLGAGWMPVEHCCWLLEWSRLLAGYDRPGGMSGGGGVGLNSEVC